MFMCKCIYPVLCFIVSVMGVHAHLWVKAALAAVAVSYRGLNDLAGTRMELSGGSARLQEPLLYT